MTDEDMQPALGLVNGLALSLAFWCGFAFAVILLVWVLPVIVRHG